MKKIHLILLLFSFIGISILTNSCRGDKAPCEIIECLNGGVCIEDICNCPENYSGINCEIFTLPIQDLLDSGQTPMELIEIGVVLDSLYGRMYEGGLIFLLDTIDGTGFLAAPFDQSSNARWGCDQNIIAGADGLVIGSGQQNTIDITTGCMELEIAAQLSADLDLNGKTDWFLPSSNELSQMYNNLKAKGHGNFATLFYWSSSEVDSDNGAYLIDLHNGYSALAGKEFQAHVRSARAF